MEGQLASDAINVAIALVQLAGGYAIACFAGAGGGVLIAKTYLTTRIKEAIKSEYAERFANLTAELKAKHETELENLKAQLRIQGDSALELLKTSLKAATDAQLEIQKAQLKAQGETALEKLKSDLAISAAKQNIEFSLLHSKRAEVIAEMHADLRDAVDAMADYTKAFEPAGGTSREERGKKAVEATNKLIRTFRTKEIYLPEPAAEKMRAITDELKFAFFQFLYGVGLGETLGEDKTKKWLEIQAKVETLSGPATTELQNDFRDLLGYRAPALP
jgi:hypothetical protein